ncbi:hypothetical protein VTJ83DRAFT_2980 [Remersonia thermophila]|uniref:Signal recognition particle subunit SRP14 n=1 Tax=Remersonia thermophila TaxID=72144 RepID=A0ABR4DCQ9_9PEZI
MGVLTHDEFFARLADVFTGPKTKGHGAVFLTQKRLTYGQEPSIQQQQQQQQQQSPSSSSPDPSSPDQTSPEIALPDLAPPAQPYPILIRATNGKGKAARDRKVKLSTVVQPDEIEAFFARYAEVCKSGMAALKPRDRTKRKAKAKKKKAGGA